MDVVGDAPKDGVESSNERQGEDEFEGRMMCCPGGYESNTWKFSKRLISCVQRFSSLLMLNHLFSLNYFL